MVYKGTQTYYNSDFSHYGVKGMKWGVRKAQKQKYGYTEKELKKTFKKAAKQQNPYITLTSISNMPGKKTAKVYSAYKKDLRDNTKDLMKEYNKKFSKDETDMDMDTYEKEFDVWDNKAHKATMSVAKKYIDSLNDARLEDIGYQDIKKGREMLREYGLEWEASPLGIKYRHTYS